MKLNGLMSAAIANMMAGLTDWNQDLVKELHSGMTYPHARHNRGFKRNRRAELKLSAKRNQQ